MVTQPLPERLRVFVLHNTHQANRTDILGGWLSSQADGPHAGQWTEAEHVVL